MPKTLPLAANSLTQTRSTLSDTTLPLPSNGSSITGTSPTESSAQQIFNVKNYQATASLSFGALFGVTPMYVMSFQMYIEADAPKIEFIDSNQTTVHTIQTSGNYIWPNAVPTLQTFAVPNIDLSSVVQVVVTSASTLTSLARVKVLTFSSSDVPLCSMTFSAEPPVLFDNVTNVAVGSVFPLTSNFPINTNPDNTVSMFDKPEYKFKPFYAIIPKLKFTGTLPTPAVSVSFVFTLKCGSTTITSSFSINTTTNAYTNFKIPIPLQSGAGTVAMDERTFNVSSSSVPHFDGSNGITLQLTSTTNVLNLSLETNSNESSGMMVQIFGTGVTIDPIFSPSTITIKSPITFASAKSVNFPPITNTSMPGAITYTIDPTTFATIDAPLTPSIKMKASSSGSTGDAVIFARSDIVLTNKLPISGFHPRSTYSQIKVNDYAKLASGTVVPFFNVAKEMFSSSASDSSFTANMFINITQNVTLDSLNFGYMIDTFLPSTTPRIANGGYASTITSPATATITFTVESVPSSQNDPLITYGSVALTAIPTSGTQHVALHTAANNADGSNDGTLMSIPFTTSAITPLPTYVSAFTPAASGSLFAFNAGDQIRIRMHCNTKGSYWSTQKINSELGELGGSLICVPKDNPYVPNVPSGISLTSGTNTQTRKPFETAAITVTAKRIITGFRLSNIRIANAVSTVENVQVDIYKNGQIILQVFFAYKETSPTQAPLEIPFSYAEYYRIHSSPNAAHVSRIVPTSLYYNKTQNPIFNANDVFQMKITFVNDATINTNATGTSIAGALSGISLNTSTLTIDPLTLNSPIFGVNRATTTVSINKPISNSDGKFAYHVSNDLANTVTTDATTGNLSLVLKAPSTSGIRTQLSISAFQRSSSSFTDNSIAYPTIDYINTNYTTDSSLLRLYTVAPTNVSGVIYKYNAAFTALIVSNNTTLVGFSFQFFGGFANAQNGSNMEFSFSVTVKNGPSNPFISKSTTISFVSNGNTNKMLFIPFSRNFFTRRPTGVDVHTNVNADNDGFLYTNTDNIDMSSITLQIGDSVEIYVSSPSGVYANTFGDAFATGKYNESALIGSLVTTCSQTSAVYIPASPTGSTTNIFNRLASEIGSAMQSTPPLNPNARIVLREFGISVGGWNTVAAAPTGTNPITMSFQITIIASTQLEYQSDIEMRFTENVGYFTIPFNMPCPGDVAAGNWGYAITKMNITPSSKRSQTTNLFPNSYSQSQERSISSFSFPIVQLNTTDIYNLVSPRISLNVTHIDSSAATLQLQPSILTSFALPYLY
jgi:hypothetical protein